MLSLYPERRRIDITSDVQMLAKTSLRASEVKSIVEQTQGIRLAPQDIKNLRLKLKGTSDDASVVQDLLQKMKADGGHASFSMDPEDGSLVYLCFSSKEMQSMLKRFPQVLLLDFTYKTNKYLMPLLTVMAIDHHGHGCPVLHAFVRNEDSDHLKVILRFLTTLYDSSQTNCFVIDKDFSEINAVGAVFPEAHINLCHFHISQAISRHIKKLTPEMSSTVHELFMRQVITESREEYEALRSQLEMILPEVSVAYFTVNWWGCPQRWATSFNVGTMKLDATTTNHLESFHGKIKATLRLEMGLSDNMNFLVTYTRELYQKFLDSTVLESNVRRYKATNPEADAVFASGVSTFIAENIVRELDLAKRVQYDVRQVEDGQYEVVYKDAVKQVTPTSCDCHFHQSMRLPCRHIFFLRSHLNIVVFQASLVHDMHFLGRTNDASSTCGAVTGTVADVRPVSVSTQEARYRRASKLCQGISVYLSILGENEFLDKYNYLSNLLRSWRDDVHGSPVDVETVTGTDGTVYLVPVNDARSISTLSIVAPNCEPSLVPVSSEVPPVSLSVSEAVCGPGSSSSVAPPVAADTVSVSEVVSAPSSSVVPPVAADTVSVGEVVSAPSSSVVPPVTADTVSVSDVVTGPAPSSSVVPPVAADTVSVGEVVSGSAPSSSEVSADASAPMSPMAVVDAPLSPIFVNVKLQRCKVKGRPKKQLFTKKRKCKVPKCFATLSLANKKLLILRAVVRDECFVDETMLIDQSMLRQQYADTVLDSMVDLAIVADNFSNSDAFNNFCSSVENMRRLQVFHCGFCCMADDGEEKMVQCGHCLYWCHFSCVGYKSALKIKNWFCAKCWTTV